MICRWFVAHLSWSSWPLCWKFPGYLPPLQQLCFVFVYGFSPSRALTRDHKQWRAAQKGEAVWRGGLKLSIVQHCGAARRPPPLSRVSYYLCVCDHRGFVRYIKRKSKAGVYLVNILLCWILHSNPCSDPIHCALTRLCVGTHVCMCLLWDSLAASQPCWSYCFSLCLAPSEYHNSLVTTRRQLRSAQFESRACKPNICLLIGRPRLAPLWTETCSAFYRDFLSQVTFTLVNGSPDNTVDKHSDDGLPLTSP